jgi:hypothetical protein
VSIAGPFNAWALDVAYICAPLTPMNASREPLPTCNGKNDNIFITITFGNIFLSHDGRAFFFGLFILITFISVMLSERYAARSRVSAPRLPAPRSTNKQRNDWWERMDMYEYQQIQSNSAVTRDMELQTKKKKNSQLMIYVRRSKLTNKNRRAADVSPLRSS